jgi:hypothetical protein
MNENINIIKFSEPWDKLNNIDGFTTIRSSNPAKLKYYTNLLNQEFEISLNGKTIGHAILRDVEELSGIDVPENILRDDVKLNGRINSLWYEKIRNMEKVILLNFERR